MEHFESMCEKMDHFELMCEIKMEHFEPII